MSRITVDEFLSILEGATPEDNPFTHVEGAEAVGAAFIVLANGMAAFTRACMAHEELGYAAAIINLEDMVHYFPKDARTFEEIAAAALADDDFAQAVALDNETDEEANVL